MLENILIAVLSFLVGGASATVLLLVKVILPRERKQRAKKRRQLEIALLTKMLSNTQEEKQWKTDRRGNIISPLHRGS